MMLFFMCYFRLSKVNSSTEFDVVETLKNQIIPDSLSKNLHMQAIDNGKIP